jgi:hypothetical protein
MTTDAAGDATVSVEMDMRTGGYDPSLDAGNWYGTVTLFADGTSTFTVIGFG